MVNRAQGALLLAVGCSLAATACAKQDDQTQITVAVTSETAIPEELDQLLVVITDARGSVANQVLHKVDSQGFFPATQAIVPRNSDSLEGPLHVSLQGLLHGVDVVVARDAIVSYVEGRNLLLPMPLRMACFSVNDCQATETCAGGTCVPASVEAEKLVDYSDALVFHAAAGASCFDEEACLSAAVPTMVGADCTFPLPGAKVNVAVQWAAAPDRIIALDADDPIEGWSDVGGGRGKLADGVCKTLGAQGTPNASLQALVSSQCAPKRPNQPCCAAGIGITLPAP